jgi:hypothetical protein
VGKSGGISPVKKKKCTLCKCTCLFVLGLGGSMYNMYVFIKKKCI